MRYEVQGAGVLGVGFGGVRGSPHLEVVGWDCVEEKWTHFNLPVPLEHALALARRLVEAKADARPKVTITVEVEDT